MLERRPRPTGLGIRRLLGPASSIVNFANGRLAAANIPSQTTRPTWVVSPLSRFRLHFGSMGSGDQSAMAMSIRRKITAILKLISLQFE
jgi:hypothetical protein